MAKRSQTLLTPGYSIISEAVFDFAEYPSYDRGLKRWLNRDPIEGRWRTSILCVCGKSGRRHDLSGFCEPKKRKLLR